MRFTFLCPDRMTKAAMPSTPSLSQRPAGHIAHKMRPSGVCPPFLGALIAITLAFAVSAAHAQPPKLNKSYFERVEQLQDQVVDGEMEEVEAVAVPSAARSKTVSVEDLNSELTWWQYDDDTTFLHVKNSTDEQIAGLKLAFWLDSCAEKKKPPNITYVVLKRSIRHNEQAVVKIPPSTSLHTKNEVSCLQIQGAWSH